MTKFFSKKRRAAKIKMRENGWGEKRNPKSMKAGTVNKRRLESNAVDFL